MKAKAYGARVNDEERLLARVVAEDADGEAHPRPSEPPDRTSRPGSAIMDRGRRFPRLRVPLQTVDDF